jgi:hypothetical protein
MTRRAPVSEVEGSRRLRAASAPVTEAEGNSPVSEVEGSKVEGSSARLRG